MTLSAERAAASAGGGGSVGDAPPRVLEAPSDVITRVFSQLDCLDLLSCSLVCKQWYMDSAEMREGWKNEYLEAWNLWTVD